MRRTSRNSEKCDDRPLHAVVVIYLILAFERDLSEVLDPNISQDTIVRKVRPKLASRTQ